MGARARRLWYRKRDADGVSRWTGYRQPVGVDCGLGVLVVALYRFLKDPLHLRRSVEFNEAVELFFGGRHQGLDVFRKRGQTRKYVTFAEREARLNLV